MSHDSKPAIILTGFGPFPGVIKNPTAELVDLIKSDPPQGFVKGKVSEVSAVGVLQTLASLQKTLSTIEKDRPVILAHLGVATMYDKFHLERFGWNGLFFIVFLN